MRNPKKAEAPNIWWMLENAGTVCFQTVRKAVVGALHWRKDAECVHKKRRRKERYWKAVGEEELRGLEFVKSGSQGLWWS